ncbi:MAG: PEGA domain-containing protein [Kofleriaceae bacterium]
MSRRGRLIALALAGALVAVPAAADPPPWSVGVTDAAKAAAQGHVDAGNAQFLAGKFVDALAAYRAALAAWDHPAIRFNVVRCLIQLDRPVEAADELKLALRYGAAPLDDAVYAEAVTYDKLLANQIGELTVTCAQRDVAVTLDGVALATCPIEISRRLRPGAHQVVGTRPGYLTEAPTVIVLGGEPTRLALTLAPLAASARVVHRWSPAVPWLVFGGGLVVAGAGGLVDLSAAADAASYDRYVAQHCAERACDRDLELAAVAALETRAAQKSVIGTGLVVVGAGAAVTGAVMLYLNRARTVSDAPPRVTPTVTPTAGGVVLSLAGDL